jgi:hypothetical protein
MEIRDVNPVGPMVLEHLKNHIDGLYKYFRNRSPPFSLSREDVKGCLFLLPPFAAAATMVGVIPPTTAVGREYTPPLPTLSRNSVGGCPFTLPPLQRQ